MIRMNKKTKQNKNQHETYQVANINIYINMNSCCLVLYSIVFV